MSLENWDGGNYREMNENDDHIFHGHHHTGEGPDYREEAPYEVTNRQLSSNWSERLYGSPPTIPQY